MVLCSLSEGDSFSAYRYSNTMNLWSFEKKGGTAIKNHSPPFERAVPFKHRIYTISIGKNLIFDFEISDF